MLSDRLVLKNILKPILIPEIEIVVDDGLGFTVKVFGYIFFCHETNVTIFMLVKERETYM